MVTASLIACHTDNILGKTDLAGNLDGKRATRLTLFQLKQRTDILHIEHHGTIGNTIGTRCIILYI